MAELWTGRVESFLLWTRGVYAVCDMVRRALYAIGGRNVTTYLDQVEKYDLTFCTWTTVAPLPKPLRCTTAVGYHGNVYVFGGETTTEIVNTAYK